MPPLIAAIVAMAENRVIGANNQLPWRLPADLQHFKALTTGHTIIMGRKTYQSIGRPLPNRRNIILTRDANFTAPGCEVVTSVEQALELTKNDQKVFIIGGAEIYQLFMPYLRHIHLTVIHQDFAGDTYFPELDNEKWRTTNSEKHTATPDNPYSYSFTELTCDP